MNSRIFERQKSASGKGSARRNPFRLAAIAIPIFVFAAALVACAGGPPPVAGTAKTQVPTSPMSAGAMPEAALPSPVQGAAMPAAPGPASAYGSFNTEEYGRIVDNPFLKALDNPVSTFSIDVDTASYSNIRRFLMDARSWPPKDAVRIEEMVNYFSYGYPGLQGEDPVSAAFALAPAPWADGHQLLRIALKAKDIDMAALPASNLVFLIDVSGSMDEENKLPLLRESLKIMIRRLRPQDRISIVTYSSSTGVALDSVPGTKKEKIEAAIDNLEAGGSTAGGAGLELAYSVAKRNFIRSGNNRILLCTDGDFNVGVSSTAELERMVEERRKDGVYLTVLGFGMGNYKDSRMETLADKGNGSYAYVDNLLEAKKVLGNEAWGSLYTVAKDVKIQIEFNPAVVGEYRLIGYENRLMSREDFNDDAKDAGEMGAGQAVTAFYELVPISAPQTGGPAADPLVFQQSTLVPSDDLLIFKLRYKNPGESKEESRLVSTRVEAKSVLAASLDVCDDDFRFASAVIEFGMLLRDSPYKGAAALSAVMERARDAKGPDREGYRAEFVKLAEMAELIDGNR